MANGSIWVPAKDVIVRTKFDGTTCAWLYHKEYQLVDGSSWVLDQSEAGIQYNNRIATSGRRSKDYTSNPIAEVSRVGQRFYLWIDTMCAKRWVVPVKLPEPSNYYYLTPSKRTPEMIAERVLVLRRLGSTPPWHVS